MSYESMSDADKTIARVWEALGYPAYSECGGLEISQIVAKRVAELEEARGELAQKDAEIEAYKTALDITRSEKTREWCIACGYKTEREAYKARLTCADQEIIKLLDEHTAFANKATANLENLGAELARRGEGMKLPDCKRCGHPAEWHSHDDTVDNTPPTDPNCPFRCMGYDCIRPGYPEGGRACDCPSYTQESPR